jgi:hypothetical protein
LQLAGVVAVEVTGGPTVEFVPGRRVCDIALTFFLINGCIFLDAHCLTFWHESGFISVPP